MESNRSYVPDTWLSNIRTFLKCCKANITVPGAWCPTCQHINDVVLMDIFESMKPSTGTLEQLNAVRLFLQELTLADLANDTGTHIEPWDLSGTRIAKVLMHWTNQGRPPEQSWALWHFF
eukprot:2748627-Ditylum_brightwellii.AAC.2